MFDVIILAAGKGKRMNQDLPKVLSLLADRPLIDYVIDAVVQSGVHEQPILVVGYKSELVHQHVGERARYAHQAELLGTGHAVSMAREQVGHDAQHVLVLNGDMPLVSPQTVSALMQQHHANGAMVTMGTVTLPDFVEWRAGFFDFGRIIRDDNGRVIGIVEKRDATPEQLAINEVNPSYFCFNVEWLWKNITALQNNNSQKEYYITDLIGLAVQAGDAIATVAIDPIEALGVNTVEHLALVEEVLRQRT